ncbi:hypothetical protein M441DRAFT_336986 [Trichoderma asperellum CBS 433.97]|uniref:Secreted protein n=1 Tax=Trichoderma asperellum (strain ATCC 204424 / CBS 433.97 / NBRC 101777) TaxID=1042311 RepID=A0A2T3ZGE9_TRIA4|nr:hypothetical protein M441DRAFT_336986 [Trichoderma asperellum CBS 433.97]PTB43885.1 hypothetical protein M441DRAFT_336986 [Trichoderma asperellum CBS 433.97]
MRLCFVLSTVSLLNTSMSPHAVCKAVVALRRRIDIFDMPKPDSWKRRRHSTTFVRVPQFPWKPTVAMQRHERIVRSHPILLRV